MSYVKIYTGTEDIDDLIGSLVQDGGKYYHYNTTNISFIVTAKKLKERGVNNHNFMLTLYDKSLADVDPFDKDLDQDIKARIMLECRKNIWYYIREIARTGMGIEKPTKFDANIGNVSQIWCFMNGIDSHLVLPSDGLYNVYQHHLLAWLFLMGSTKTNIKIIDKNTDVSRKHLEIIKNNTNCLPEYMQYTGVSNLGRLTSKVNENEIITTCKATTQEAALNLARGLTSPIQFFNCFEYIPFIKTILEQSEPIYDRVKTIAIKDGNIYGRIFTSVPGDLDTQSGKDSYKMIKTFRKWNDKTLDRSIASIKRSNTPFYIVYDYKDIGLSDDWYVRMKRFLKNDDKRFKREVLLERV